MCEASTSWDSPSPASLNDSTASTDDDLRKAAEFGAILLKKNAELEAAMAGLQDQVVTLQALADAQCRDLIEHKRTIAELQGQLDSVVRDNMHHAEAVMRQKSLEEERDSLRRSAEDARTALAFLALERDDALAHAASAEERASAAESRRQSVMTDTRLNARAKPVDIATVVEVTKAEPVCASVRSQLTFLKDKVKQQAATIVELTNAGQAKDEEIERLSVVVQRQEAEAAEASEVLRSVRASTGPSTPLRLSRIGPAFVISPTDTPGWMGMDLPFDFACPSPLPHPAAALTQTVTQPTLVTQTVSQQAPPAQPAPAAENVPPPSSPEMMTGSLEAFIAGRESTVGMKRNKASGGGKENGSSGFLASLTNALPRGQVGTPTSGLGMIRSLSREALASMKTSIKKMRV